MSKVNAVVAEVRRLAEEYPAAIYPTEESYYVTRPDGQEIEVECSYTQGIVKNGPETEGCIIGQAIARVLPEVDLTDLEGDTPTNKGFVALLETEVGDPRLRWMKNIQIHQDCGKPWARAVVLADEFTWQ